MLGKNIILPLDRPEYVGLNETFISALAWRIASIEVDGKEWPEPKTGLAYDSTSPRADTIYIFNREFRESDRWVSSLEESGLMTHGADLPLSAIAESFRGAESKKGFNHSVVPLTPSLALCQNTIGALRRPRPHNLGQIIEQIYALGKPNGEAHDGKSAAGQWYQAMEWLLERDEFLQVIDQAVRRSVFPEGHKLVINPEKSADDLLSTCVIPSGFGGDTPFGWFRESWDLITSKEWVDHLPVRRWIDWSLTILRAAYGLSFLWEMAWYESIATTVRDGSYSKDFTQEDLISKVSKRPLLDWANREKPISYRSITQATRASILRGVNIRKTLEGLLNSNSGLADLPIYEVLAHLNQDEDKRTELIRSRETEDLNFSGAPNNIWESIGYALRLRQDSGPYADHYSLLSNQESRNFTVVEPATEWIAVMSSLTCKSPKGITTLGDFMADLKKIGLSPTKTELLYHLEISGLAKSSADADLAIEITSAY